MIVNDRTDLCLEGFSFNQDYKISLDFI